MSEADWLIVLELQAHLPLKCPNMRYWVNVPVAEVHLLCDMIKLYIQDS